MNQNHLSRICPNCKLPALDEDVFCVKCGAKLPDAGNYDSLVPTADDSQLPSHCSKCGAQFEKDDCFCPSCGQPIGENPSPSMAVPPPLPDAQHSQSASSTGKKPINKRVIMVAAIIAATVVVVVIVVAVLLLRGKEEPDNSAESPSLGMLSESPEKSSLSPDNEPSDESSGDVLPSQPLETEVPASNSVSLPNLYVGPWAAQGCTIDDEVNGWQAFYLESIRESTLTFYLESVQSAPSNRIANTYPITVTINDGTGTFPVNDSWGNSGTGEIIIKGNAIHITVDITAPDSTAMWDIGMDADFYPARTIVSSDQPQQTPSPDIWVDPSVTDWPQQTPPPNISEAPSAEPVPTGFGTTEEAIRQEFENQSLRHGASFSVENPVFYSDATSGAFGFDSREVSVYFMYSFDRRYGDISISNAQNPSKLTELANAVFLILSGNDESESFRGLPARVWDSEPYHSAVYDEETAAEIGDMYVESVTDTYEATYSADGYTCEFFMYHVYYSLQYGTSNDFYTCRVKFSK